MIVVYIAGPFRAPDNWQREGNIREAETLALAAWAIDGVAVLCPHTNTRYFEGALPDHVWLDGYLELLRRCDAVLTTPRWTQSKGASAEVEAARQWHLPIFHTVEALAAWVESRPSRALVVGTQGGEAPRR